MRRLLQGITVAAGLAILGADGGQVATVLAAQGSASAPAEEQAMDLNTATAKELERLPGVGPATALRIVEHREANGPFERVEELMVIRGIGEKTFLRLKPLVRVTTVDGSAR